MSEWKTVAKYPVYEVSDGGQVRGPNGLLRIFRTVSGYMRANLVMPGVARKQSLVHHLVLDAFVGPRPSGQQCRHLDGNKENNAIGNLRWGTPVENAADRVAHGTSKRVARGEDHYRSKLSNEQRAEVLALWNQGFQAKHIGQLFGVTAQTAFCVTRGDVNRRKRPVGRQTAR